MKEKINIIDAQKDVELMNLFIEENMGLVHHIMWKYFRSLAGTNNWDDVLAYGMEGLYRAATRFNPDYGLQFSTYAIPFVLGTMKRQIRDEETHYGLHLARPIRKIMNSYEDLQLQGMDDTEIADKLQVSMKDIEFAKTKMTGMFYLEGVTNDKDGKEREHSEVVKSSDNTEEKTITKIFLQELKKKIGPNRTKVLEMYLFGMTQMEIAKEMGRSQAQVSRLLLEVQSIARRLAGVGDSGKENFFTGNKTAS